MYKRKITDSNKKILKLRKSLHRLWQPGGGSEGSDSRHSYDVDLKPSNRALDRRQTDDEFERKQRDIILVLFDEQIKFINLVLNRLIIFWNPSFNYGVDITSKVQSDRGFLDMLGLGDKQIWSGSNYGGKVMNIVDVENEEHDNLEKLIDLSELYRYSMIYSYLQILGLIYRRTKNFERAVRSRFRLFKNVRKRLTMTRDVLALMLGTDLPNEGDLPLPVAPPYYLNMGENCSEEIYEQISREISFFREVQDENRGLLTRIRNGTCGKHELTGCSSCEIKKLTISILEWEILDVQMDIQRLERDLKLCRDSIQKNSSCGPSGSNEGGESTSGGGDSAGTPPDQDRSCGLDEEGSPDLGRRDALGGWDGADGSPEKKRFKRRSLNVRTSRKTSKRRGSRTRRGRSGRVRGDSSPRHNKRVGSGRTGRKLDRETGSSAGADPGPSHPPGTAADSSLRNGQTGRPGDKCSAGPDSAVSSSEPTSYMESEVEADTDESATPSTDSDSPDAFSWPQSCSESSPRTGRDSEHGPTGSQHYPQRRGARRR
ncbi:hypothetical protein HWI79_3607 [Cryptosporidium felis]|nr:hypothetical protein HWI79_3607 [Cryptosporidium felis]